MIRTNKAGDTLVEVLISIAIVSVVITGAYSLANRSLHQGINASEHTQALKFAESQLESLKFRQQLSSTTDYTDNFAYGKPSSPQNYCLDITATGPTDSKWGPIANSNPDPVNLTGYSAQCVDSQYKKYYMNINVANTTVQGTVQTVYLVTVRWNAIGGGQSQTQIYYRF